MLSASCMPATLMVIDPWTGGWEARLRRHSYANGLCRDVSVGDVQWRERRRHTRQAGRLSPDAGISLFVLCSGSPISAVPRYAAPG